LAALVCTPPVREHVTIIFLIFSPFLNDKYPVILIR